VVRHAAAIENMAATLKALAAARAADGNVWNNSGDRSPAHALARESGTSVSAAADALDSARRLAEQPALNDAARRGELSAPKVAAVSDAAAADPDAEEALVNKAGRSSLRELRDDCARVKAAADPDPEGTRQRIHDERSLREYTDRHGVWNLVARGNPEKGAEIMAAIRPLADKLFDNARKEGRREHTEKYAFDALVELANGAKVKGGRHKIIVRVDLDTLLRGYPVDDEVCEIVGYGPVAVSAVRDMIESGNPFLAAVATVGHQVFGVAHLKRKPTVFQITALEWMYPVCAAEGCSQVAYLENDHRIDWSKTKFTLLDLLDRLCSHDHDLKTRSGWMLVDGHGKRPFVPPDDPRHPRHTNNANAPPQAA